MLQITKEQREQLLKYLMARPYAEVAQMVAMLASLKLIDNIISYHFRQGMPSCRIGLPATSTQRELLITLSPNCHTLDKYVFHIIVIFA